MRGVRNSVAVVVALTLVLVAHAETIIGRVVHPPGKPPFEGLGLGITWRTPWSGQLTVGAENVITRGKNPFAPSNDTSDEGTVPYVRYEQDL